MTENNSVKLTDLVMELIAVRNSIKQCSNWEANLIKRAQMQEWLKALDSVVPRLRVADCIWHHEDNLPEGYNYDEYFHLSRVIDGVRMFPCVGRGE